MFTKNYRSTQLTQTNNTSYRLLETCIKKFKNYNRRFLASVCILNN